jgi:hypothetical protein
MSYTDVHGTKHEVVIVTTHHDYFTAAGERRADCLCGWWDHHPYLPGGRAYADVKLQLRAMAAHEDKPAVVAS